MTTAKILAYRPQTINVFDPYDRVEFSLDDGDSCVVCIHDSISFAMVCFLVEHTQLPDGAWGKMLNAIYAADCDNTSAEIAAQLIGREFTDE